jgi:predicted lipid-binding transport protein (Tim44 family)
VLQPIGDAMSKWRNWVLALLCGLIVFAPALAEARAGGGYRSGGGMSYQSQGSLGSRTYNNDNGGQQVGRSMTPQTQPTSPYYGGQNYSGGFMQRHPFLTGLAGAFFGSWIGSLLFPHWGMGMGFGSVFGSLLTWILIIVGIAMLFRLFRRDHGPLTMPHLGNGGGMGFGGPQQSAFGFGGFGGGGGAAPSPSRDLTVSEADYAAFEAILKAVQDAWSQGDLRALSHYVTPEMVSYFSEELAANRSQGVENRVEQVELLKGDVREAWDEGKFQYATALLHWRALDYTRRIDQPASIVDGDAHRPSEAQELWTFARTPGGHWLLSAIQQV